MQSEPRVASARAASAIITVATHRTILAWAAAGPIVVSISNVVDGAMPLVIKWVHLYCCHVALLLMTLQAYI
jgi:hypothetical protein